MTLKELEKYNHITIQCHDNPDADTLACGYAMYRYFSDLGKDVSLIYSGRYRLRKSNLVLMVDTLNIPIEYRQNNSEHIEGLLLTVDCQYGAGNVTRFLADTVAVIDHHQLETTEQTLSEIQSDLGACSTLVWNMLKDAGYEGISDDNIGTALYYGLYTDTNAFSEIFNPRDMDMRDEVNCNKSMITLFRNSNISRDELEIAGIALIRNIYNDKHRFSIIRSGACDPNILGLISDFLLQVDGVDVCVVYNELEDGFKLSVRSCVKEVKANELAEYLCMDIGSGGGHIEKAGGFISKAKYEIKYPNIHSESYFGDRMHQYFEDTEVLNSGEVTLDISQMQKYVKKKLPIGFVRAKDVFPIDTPIVVRTLEGDFELKVTEDLIIMIGVKGEVYPSRVEKFERSYTVLDGEYRLEDSVVPATYVPRITNKITGEVKSITDYAHKCVSSGETEIYAKQLDHYVKLFTQWDKESYMLGKPGDYLAMRTDDCNDLYVIERKILGLTYDEI